jgi:hygromycin-B 7''-O-kinase
MPPAIEPSPSALKLIAERHHLAAAADLVKAPTQGVANHVYFLGEHLVLRIARPEPHFVADLRKEADVIPVVGQLGVRTPALVDFDDSCGLIDTPYMILQRVTGATPAIPKHPVTAPWGRVYRDLGADLARLHSANLTPADLPRVPVDERGDPRVGIANLASSGHISTDAAAWLTAWLDHLAHYLPDQPQFRLLHGDASPTNLLADTETTQLRALIDWGDAAWADPAMDFAKLPLRAVTYALQGYLDGATADTHTAWSARVLRHHLSWALFRVAKPPNPDEATWNAQPASRLLDIMRFYLDGPPDPWRGLYLAPPVTDHDLHGPDAVNAHPHFPAH